MPAIIAHIPGLGAIKADTRLLPLDACSDGIFRRGQNGVAAILSTGDGKVEFIAFAGHGRKGS